jgi:hypothetical protein
MSRGAILWVAAAALVALIGVLAGRTIKGGGEPPFPFDVSAPAYSGADLPLARSRGGFTGFSETGGLDGSVIAAGRVTALNAGSMTLETNAGVSTIRVGGDQKLRVLQPFQGPIPTGATVAVLRKPGTNEAQSVLVLLDP